MTERLEHQWTKAIAVTGMVRCEACRLIVGAAGARALEEECPARLRAALDKAMATNAAIEDRIVLVALRVEELAKALEAQQTMRREA